MGELGPTQVTENIDLADPLSRRLVLRALSEGFDISPQLRARIIEVSENLMCSDKERLMSSGASIALKAMQLDFERLKLLLQQANTDEGRPDSITEIRVTRAAKPLPDVDD